MFCSFDVISLVVQGAGGGIASSANTPQGTKNVRYCFVIYRGPKKLTGALGGTYNAWGDCVPIVCVIAGFSVISGIADCYASVSLIVYVIAAIEFFLRFFADKPIREASNSRTKLTLEPRMKIMLAGLIFSTTCLFIRYIDSHCQAMFKLTVLSFLVRSIVPLSWPTVGKAGSFPPRFILVRWWQLVFGAILIMTLLTDVLDGGMVILAIYTLNIVHPGRLLRDHLTTDTEKNFDRSSEEV